MSIRVEIEGGSTLEFPDGTSDSIIDATAKRYLQPDKPEKKGIGWFSDTLSNIGTGMSKMAQSESTGARATQEAVGNIASGALAWIPAGLYGAAKLYSDTALKGVKGTDYGAIKQDVNSIQNALTYSPKGEQGKLLAETLTSPLTAVSNKFIEGAEYSKKQAEKAAQAGDLETAKKWLAAESAAEFGSEAWMFALPGIFKGAKVARGIPKKLSLKSLEGIIPEEVAKGDYAVTPDVREQLVTKKPLAVEQKPIVPVVEEAPVVQAARPVVKPRQKNVKPVAEPVIEPPVIEEKPVMVESKPPVEVAPPPVVKPIIQEKVIPTTKKAEANVVSPKEQKKYLMDSIDEALKDAPNGQEIPKGRYSRFAERPKGLGEQRNEFNKTKQTVGTVKIEIPNDGTFEILNTKQALEEFKKQSKSFPSSVIKGAKDVKPTQSSTRPTGKRMEMGEVSYYNDFKPRKQELITDNDIRTDFYTSGFYTNGKYAVKTTKPKIPLSEQQPDLNKAIPKESVPAKIVAEFNNGYGDRTVTQAHIVGDNGYEVSANAHYVDVVLTKHPDAKVFVSEGMRPIVFKKGKEVVGLVMPIEDAVPSKEFINEFRPPVKSEPKGVTLTSGIDPTQIMPVLRSLSESTSQFIKKYETPPEIKKGVQSAIKSMVDHHRLNREAEFLSQQLKKVVNDVVPNPERQMLITHAVEHKLQGKYFDQLNEIEKGVARWATGENQKLRQFLEKNGAIELMPDTNSVTHVYHWWINEKTGEPYSPMYGRFSKGAPQGKKRTIPTYEYGMLKGQKPATTNIGELIGLEWESATRANSANKLFQSLHEIKGDSSTVIKRSPKGSPQQIRLIESWSSLEQQGLTNGYKRYSSPFLNKAKTHIADDGRLVTMKGDVGIKEELYPHVRAYLESPTYGKLSEIAFAAKNLKLSGTLFHVVSLGMQELANLRIPFVHVPKGLKLRQELGPGMKLLHSEGLELLKGYEDFGGKGNLFRGEHPAIKYANIAAKPLTIFRDFTFDIVQPGMKMSMADFLLNKYLPKYMEKTGWSAEQVMKAYEKGENIPPAIETRMRQCAREVVQKVDGHFSGEDYKRGLLETNRFMADLYFSPEAKKFWQMALLSPTWQREHLLVAKNVAKSFMPNSLIKKLGMSEMGPIKGAYRRYALGAALMISAVDMWNYMSTGVMDGKSVHMWDNPEGKKFGVRAWWNEPAYIDYNKDGERIYHPPARAYIRPLKSVFEVAEGSTNIVHKVSNKLAPPPKAIGEQFFGSKKYGGTTDMPNRAKDFMLDLALPMMANQVIMAAQGKQSVKAALLPFVGMPVSREKTKTKNLK